MTLNTQQSNGKRIALQAVEWQMRLRNPTQHDKAAFSAWLLESRSHVRNFLLLLALDKELGKLDPECRHDVDALIAQARTAPVPHPAISQPAHHLEDPAIRRRRRRTWSLALAAVAASLVLAVTLNLQILPTAVEYATSTGEQRSVKLPDGSLVHLNTRSRLALRFSDSQRDVLLLDGEALFIVQHDASRPFRVITDTAVAQAVGTQFNVYKHPGFTTVSVVEGRVQVTAEGKSTAVQHSGTHSSALSAGEEASVSRDGVIERQVAADPNAAVAWRTRRLAFQDAPLATIVQELNRYNTLQLRLEGTELQQRKFTGVLDADKPESLLRLLSKEGDLRFVQRDNEMTIQPRN